jgi:hypothetical protein
MTDARVPFVMFRYTETSGSVYAEQLLTYNPSCRTSSSYCVRRVTGFPSSSTNLTRPGTACDVNVTSLNLCEVCVFMQKQEYSLSPRGVERQNEYYV